MVEGGGEGFVEGGELRWVIGSDGLGGDEGWMWIEGHKKRPRPRKFEWIQYWN